MLSTPGLPLECPTSPNYAYSPPLMLHTLPLPPLSCCSRDNAPGKDSSEPNYYRNLSRKRVKNDNLPIGHPAFTFSHPHVIPLSTYPIRAIDSSTLSSPPPPCHLPNPHHPRHVPSVRQVLPTSVSRQHTLDIPPFMSTPKSSRPSTAFSVVVNILFHSELIGEGLNLQGKIV